MKTTTKATQLTLIVLGIHCPIALPAMAANGSDISVATPIPTLSESSVSQLSPTDLKPESAPGDRSPQASDRPNTNYPISSDLFNAPPEQDKQKSTLNLERQLEKQKIAKDSPLAQLSPASPQPNIQPVLPPAQTLDPPPEPATANFNQPSNEQITSVRSSDSSDSFNALATGEQQNSTLNLDRELEKPEIPNDSAIVQLSPAPQQPNTQPISPSSETLDSILDSETDNLGEQSIEQVTSVSQLSDVQPTDWAFQALQSLVERYGCIAGYPDGTFRGNRAMTRYEFAAGLNACLDKVSELIRSGTTNLATKEDLTKLQRLQEEFATELATLRGRVDALEARTAELEANQFSTTTKLNGQVLTYLGDAFGKNASDANNTTFGYRTRLNLSTSFTGKDNLAIGLVATNLRRFNVAAEFPTGRLSGVTDETRFLGSSMSGNSELRLSRLLYSFPLNNNVRVSIAAFSNDRVLTEALSPFSNPAIGAISYFGAANPMLYPISQQAGISAQWKVASWLNLDVSLGSESRSPNDPTIGLFKGGYGASVRPVLELGNFRLAFNYVNSYSRASGIDTASGSNAAKVIGAGAVSGNTYLVGVSYDLTRTIQVGGSVAYANARALGRGSRGDADVWDYRVSLALRDVGKKGNLAGLVFGMQPRLAGTSNSSIARAIGLPAGQRSDRDVGYHIEAFYTHRINDNIAITPGIIWLTAPNHDDRNPDVVVGVFRTSFSF